MIGLGSPPAVPTMNQVKKLAINGKLILSERKAPEQDAMTRANLKQSFRIA